MTKILTAYSASMLVLIIGAATGWASGYPAWGIVLGAVAGVGVAVGLSLRDLRLATEIQRALQRQEAIALDQRLLASPGLMGDIYRSATRHVVTTSERSTTEVEQIQQQAQLLDRMNEGLMRVSSDGIVTFANVAASTLFGGRNPVNRSFIGVTRDHELNAALRACLRTGLQQRHTFELAGQGRIVEGIIVLLDDSPPEALVMLRDITEMNRLLNLRRDFVANVSHELRTPLSTIKVLTETLMELKSEDGESMEFLSKIDSEVDSMAALVRDLLDLTRLESGAGRLALRLVDVATMVDEVCDRMRPLAKRNGVTIQMCVAPDAGSVAIDERRIHQSLINLISNAIAHSQAGDVVTVKATGDREKVALEVSDTGSGIAPADLPRVWERFFKSDRARTGPGTGLGLAIVKHIVQAHGGSVSASSEVGVGSTFHISIPRGNVTATSEPHMAAGIYVPS